MPLPLHPNGSKLDRNALFALEFHTVEQLALHLAFCDCPSELHHAISKGRLAMVNVGDDTKITNIMSIHFLRTEPKKICRKRRTTGSASVKRNSLLIHT